ncbi:MAG TPA: type II toxin-antitoxin system HicB family antitoxin, partial [Chloroflexia bacterium]|nr:type II toxin-antitoxin system HicB family antitoxin [Chloroflexia bacterium]
TSKGLVRPVMKEYLVVYERTENNWAAHAPDVPGCIVPAKTRAHVEKKFTAALAFHFAGLKEEGYPIPEPAAEAGRVAVPA